MNDNSRSTPQKEFENLQRIWASSVEAKPNDGPVWKAMKWFARLHVWHHLYNLCMSERISHKDVEMSTRDAQSHVRNARDSYNIDWLIVLSAFYVLCWATSEGTDSCSFALRIIASFVAVTRLFELLAFIVGAHLARDYTTGDWRRSLLGLFEDYLHVCLSFGILYFAVASCCGDDFGASGSFLDSPINAIYFSVITITTTGFGDYHPESWMGKTLVMLEVAYGLLFLLVVIQNIFRAANTE